MESRLAEKQQQRSEGDDLAPPPVVKAKSDGSSGSSQSSQGSPTLSPSQNPAMTNSMISNLDLGSEGEGGEEENQRVGSCMGGGPAIMIQEQANGRLTTSCPAASTTMLHFNARPSPLAPRDVLGQTERPSAAVASTSASSNSSKTQLVASSTLFDETCPGADDSALDALMEAHQKDDSLGSIASTSSATSSSNAAVAQKAGAATTASTSFSTSDGTPYKRDASFGLDPDADTTQSIKSKPFRLTPSLVAASGVGGSSSSGGGSSSSQHLHHSHPHTKSTSHHHHQEEDPSAHHSHSTEDDDTMKTGSDHTQTVPSVSATGMPRFLPRHRHRKSKSSSSSSAGSAAASEYSSRSSHAPAPKEMMPQYPPSGSLTIAIFSKDLTWRRRLYLLLASLAINVGLPFVNGVMLGFGEIFARTIVAPWIGLAPGAINVNSPGPSNNKVAAAAPATSANTGGAGLRLAGVGGNGQLRGGGGNDGAAVSIESWEVDAGQRGRGRRT